MSTILWSLIFIGLLVGFFKAKLGVIGLLVMAIVLWNLIGGIIDHFNGDRV